MDVCVDPEETIEEQEKRVMKYNEVGDRHFTEEGSVADISIDLVVQARAKISENKVNGPEDSIMSDGDQTDATKRKSTRSQDAFKIALGSWKMPPGRGRV